MTFISVPFFLFIIATLLVYYLSPVRIRWIVLLAASMSFYLISCREAFWFLLLTIVISYFMGRILSHFAQADIKCRRALLAGSVILIVLPLFVVKEGNFILQILHRGQISFIVPLGISFYTLQIISYLVDIYHQKIAPEKNFFHYALYISYFPQIIQGPIPRFSQLGNQLCEEHPLNETTFIKGFHLILWGCFLKLMIADKAGVMVDTVFASWELYRGAYIWVIAVLYSIQLYTDFQSCVCIAKGVSELFGITLADNFDHPFFAQSISEYWRRWHMSLSFWLRDYVYIPLGGNRKGRCRKYLNLLAVFAVSGMWHGAGYKYLFWGLLHGVFQIIGDITRPAKQRLLHFFGVKDDDSLLKLVRICCTFLLVSFALVIFRADSLRSGLSMVFSAFTTYNPWILFDDSLLSLGLSWKEWVVLMASILVLIRVSLVQEKVCIRDKILQQGVVTRGLIYLTVIMVIVVFGTYGYGFNAADFIYGGF